MKSHFMLAIVVMALLAVFAGCGPTGDSGTSGGAGNDAPATEAVEGGAGAADEGPVRAIEDYLQARVEGNADTLRLLSCADWEGQAAIQAQSFRSMNAELEGVSCRADGTDGDYTLVTCEGKIVTSYNGETRDWPLGTYRTIEEGGEWRMCGEG